MNPISTRRVAAGAAALALLTGGGILVGCGGSDSSSGGGTTRAAADPSTEAANGVESKPASEIIAASLAAANAASSVTAVGSDSDMEGADGPSFDLVLGADASRGSITLNGRPLMEFRQVGANLYWKFTRAGAESIIGPGEGSELLGGRWVFAPVGSKEGGAGFLDGLFDKDALLAELLQPKNARTVAGTGEVRGTPVVFVKFMDGKATGTLAIRTTGEPLPVEIKGSADNGKVTFSDWNAPVDVTVPEGAVSVDDLLKQAGTPG